MKMYSNGQRPTKMYAGGMAMPRKPMMMGGLAEKNREQTTMTAPKKDPMGMMTQEKKFGMGYSLGGAIKKFEGKQKKANGGKAMTPKQKKFAALAEPRDKITYADKIAGATKT